ncbi:phage tail sheath subtilisin-like domain-containing protein [Lactobacillus amylovorus]|uniref:Phage tail sheath subtilisin-like domain-containing protein n=1 Tax=Lactobacillus amylovorus TaxID=1604 RepID=A0A9X3W6P6_LACAM|nr:phage tail sheath C-terminal domain-containing protein [Lactobacillus amylovorus]MDB6261148.1 phage tail sheath subtilisin-like domain-containing protein [Lactobacillus amylovorus]
MAGGTWRMQNKVRPGVYINVKSDGKPTVATPLGRLLMFQNEPLGWGKKGIIELTTASDFIALTGHKNTDEVLAPVHEALKSAETVLLLNDFDGGAKSTAKSEGVYTINAKYEGEQGNNISVSFVPAPLADGAKTRDVTVTTIFGTKEVDQTKITLPLANTEAITAAGLTKEDQLEVHNDYVDITFGVPADVTKELNAKGEYPLYTAIFNGLTQSAVNAHLTGGSNGTNHVADDMNDYLENEFYAVATTAGWDESSNIHKLLAEEIKILRENVGIKVRAVLPNVSCVAYNYEGVSTVLNGYVLNDGTVITPNIATARFAGMSASATPDQALTYAQLDDAVEAKPKLNNDKTIEALSAGQIVFTTRAGQRVVVEQDINSLTKFTDTKSKDFSKNRVIRTLDEICTNTAQTFETSFLGKVSNNEFGRDLFKANRVSYLSGLESQNVIRDFDPSDLSLAQGDDKDAVLMDLYVTPVDSMEKLYVNLVVR